MPRCGCQDACSCLIVAGDGISVEGIGTLERPYEITSESADLTGRIEFTDDGNVDFSATGVGTINDPLTVFADAVLAVDDLTDVIDDTPPVEGDVLVWRIDHWEYEQQSGGIGLPPGGTDGQVLTKQSSADGDALWETPAAGGGGGGGVVEPVFASARATSAGQSLVSGTSTKVNYEIDTYTNGITWDATNLGFVVPVSGWYEVDASMQFGAHATGYRQLSVAVNGASVATGAVIPNSATAGPTVHTSKSIKLVAGDIVSVYCYQNSGVASIIGASAIYSFFSLAKVPELAAGGGGIVVERPAYGQWYRSGNQTLTNNAAAQVVFDTVNSTPPVGMSLDAAGTVTVTEAGLYMITAHLSWAPNAVGNRYGYLYAGTGPSGSLIGRTMTATNTLGGGYSGMTMAGAKYLEAGDVIRVVAYQNSGGNLDLFNDTTNRASGLEVTKIPASYSGSAVSTYGERIYASSRGHLAATSIPNGTWTAIPYDTPQYEDGVTWEAPDKYRIPVDGYYQVDAGGCLAANATGYRSFSIYQNSTPKASVAAAPSGSITSMTTSVTVKCVAGDYITGRLWHNSGAALAMAGSTNNNFLTVTKVPAPVINGAAASGIWGNAPLDTTTFGTNPATGNEVYIDAAGQLRSRPQGIAARLVTDLATLYPAGASYFYVPGADGPNWPSNGSGIVTTTKTTNNVALQHCALFSNTVTKVWVREGGATSWGPWVQIADSTVPPRTARRKSTSQSLVASTWAAVTFDVDVEGTAGIPYSNGVFTIDVAGVYQINAQCLFGGLTAGAQTRMRFLIDGAGISENVVNAGGTGDTMTVSKSWRLAVGQTVTVQAFATSAGNVTGSGVPYTNVDLTRISA